MLTPSVETTEDGVTEDLGAEVRKKIGEAGSGQHLMTTRLKGCKQLKITTPVDQRTAPKATPNI